MFFFSSFLFFLVLLSWLCFPMFMKFYSFNLSILFFFCCLSMGVYSVMLAGWSSNSTYSLLGSLRAIAQTISYEVSLVFIFLSMIFLVKNYNFLYFFDYQKFIWFIFMCFPLMIIWFSIILAETNRTPFDLAEGESELVSGFNVEYSSGGFAMIFLAEYASILFMSMIFVVVFLGGNMMELKFYIMISFISLIFIWVRGVLPRFRYDKLMDLAWKSFLPFSLNYLMMMIGLMLYMF